MFEHQTKKSKVHSPTSDLSTWELILPKGNKIRQINEFFSELVLQLADMLSDYNKDQTVASLL